METIVHPGRTERSLLAPKDEPTPVLIVDDDALIRDLCARVLSHYRVLQADNGRDALQLLERERVDLVLTDVMMPAMDGLDLLKALKEKEPTLAVVVMTGYADKEVVLQALKADADDFITKPINLLQLRTTIDKVLEKKALKEELVHLKHMDRLKSEFLGLISHKLKTPTTAISLFIQNLARGIGDPADPEFQQTLNLILEESTYLEHLIQDLLHYSEVILQEGPPKLADVGLKELARAVLTEMKEAAHGKGITLVDDLDPLQVRLELDRKKVGFALRELLDNAVKFTPPGGTVALRGEADGSLARLTVRDSGQGIPREDLPKVFEKFYQIDPAHTGQIRGFGLGLFYARQFVQSHGGTIQLSSEPGRGTIATLTLPC
jgi:signal transduction histidine kinase